MPILFFILFLLFPSIVSAVPSTTVSIAPAAVDATTITAADENDRNSDVSTWANNHDHNDIDQTANTLAVGDAAAGNKTIQANNADTNKPFVRYDDTNNRWVSARDGSTVETFMVVTGATNANFVFPQSPANGDSLINNGSYWTSVSSRYVVGSFTRDISTASGNQTITGVGFTPKAVIFFAGIQSDTETVSWGLDDKTTAGVLADRIDAGGGYEINSGESINMTQGASTLATASVSSFTTDGFILTWVKTGTPTGTATVKYMAFR